MVDIARLEEFQPDFPEVELMAGGKPIRIGMYAYKLTKAGIWVERQCVKNNPAWETQWSLDFEGHQKKTWFPFGKKKDGKQVKLVAEYVFKKAEVNEP